MNTIIDDLAIDSVVSTDGVDRHQVQIIVRTAGDQFLEAGLPDGARLWSLLVDQKPVKPVQNLTDPGSLRIHLPAHVDSKKPTHIRLIFEADAADWRAYGRRQLPTIELSDAIPILRSTWQLHLPEGYSYRDFESNLTAHFDEQPKVLMSYLWDHLNPPVQPQYAPPQTMLAQQQAAFRMGEESPAKAFVKQKLTNIIIPELEFDDTPLSQAIEFLRTKSIEMDHLNADPQKKGLNIVIRTGAGGGDFGAPAGDQVDLGFDEPSTNNHQGFGGGVGTDDPNISLRLTNVPLVEALRYTTELARLKYRIAENGNIEIIPLTEISEDLMTQTFMIPPTWLDPPDYSNSPADPFAELNRSNPVQQAEPQPRT
ncbi:MAG: hypothetical protein AAF585_23425, partial [Verrucomicrobiota bacterium]